MGNGHIAGTVVGVAVEERVLRFCLEESVCKRLEALYFAALS